MIDNELLERIVEDHRLFAGKVIGVTFCQLGDGTDGGYREANFPKDKPLMVRISETFQPDHDINPDRRVTDTYYDAEALPGQLADKDYVSWVDGPTYHDADSAELPRNWVRLPGPLSHDTFRYLFEVWGRTAVDQLSNTEAALILENIYVDKPGPDDYLADKEIWDAYAQLHGLPTWQNITPGQFPASDRERNPNEPFPSQLVEQLMPDLTPEQKAKVVNLFDHAFNHPWVDDDARASMAQNICNEYKIPVPAEYQEDD